MDYGLGQTPLDEDEKEGLLIKSISTRAELDPFEQQNIEDALTWTLKNKFTAEQILTETFICRLHKKMYGDVWRWAGAFRKTNKNIGVDKYDIGIELRKLIEDGEYWIQHQVYPADETAIRFKHRLVSIHCFPNGNGRHSRLVADVMVSHIFKLPVFTWRRSTLVQEGDPRRAYLDAIRAADAGDHKPLLAFARS